MPKKLTKRRRPARRRRAATMTAGEAVVATLIGHGLDTIYALPGVQNDYFFDALAKYADRLRTVHTRHEQGAAYMALGAALATGKPQAYCVVPGPGLLNSGGGAAHGLWHERAGAGAVRPDPADGDIGRGLGHLHEIRDQAGIIARLVDWSAQIRTPERGAAPGRLGDAAPCSPAGPGRRRWNAPSTSGASQARCRLQAPAAGPRAADRRRRHPRPRQSASAPRSGR